MRAITLALGLGAAVALSVGPTVLACPDGDHSHEHSDARRAEPQVPISPPSRPLVWGDVNIIHTTDSHGWLLGHQKSSFPEPNYRYVCVYYVGAHNYPDRLPFFFENSGDFGDFASFVAHMKELAIVRGVFSLVVSV
jgi:2',3'-cyclic-nucleotide 2'-phosphodiesterase (5'-nucleotidase family)